MDLKGHFRYFAIFLLKPKRVVKVRTITLDGVKPSLVYRYNEVNVLQKKYLNIA